MHFRKKFCKTGFVNAKNALESSLKSSNSDEFKELNIFLYLCEKSPFSRANDLDLMTFRSILVKNKGFLLIFLVFLKDAKKVSSTIKRIAKFHAKSKKESPVFIEF